MAENEMNVAPDFAWQMLNALPQAMLVLDAAGSIRYSNVAGARLLGRPVTALARADLNVFIYPEDRHRWQSMVRQCHAGSSVAGELRLLQGEGASVLAHVNCRPRPDGAAGALVTLRAIAGQEEETFRTLSDSIVNALPGIFYVLDEEGKLIRANENLERMTGYSVEELQALGTFRLVSAKDQEKAKQQLATVFREGQARAEIHLVDKVGRVRPYLFTGQRVVIAGAPCIIGMGLDISERRHLEEALRDTAAVLSSTLELDEVFDHILANVGLVVEHSAAGILLVEEDEVRVVRLSGDVGQESRALEGVSVLHEMWRTQQPMAIADTERHPEWVAQPDLAWVHSVAAAPICSEGEVVGFLILLSEQAGFFTSAHAERLLTFADQAAVAIQNARLFNETRRRTRRLALVNELSMTLNLRLDLNDVLLTAVDGLAQVVDMGLPGLGLFDASRQNLDLVAVYPDTSAPGKLRLPVGGNAAIQRILKTGEPLVVEDVQREPQLASLQEQLAQWNVRSLLVLPLIVRDEIIGLMGYATQEEVHTFSEGEVELAQTAANQIATRIDLARTFEAERRRRREIEAVHQANLGLAASLELPQVFRAILQALVELLDVRSADIFLYEDGQLHFGLAMSPSGVREEPFAPPRRDGLTHAVATSGEAIFIPDTQGHLLFTEAPSEWGRFAIAGLPLQIGEDVVGVMNVSYPEPHRFSRSEMRILNLLAAQAAIAIQKARLHGQIQRHAQELERRVEARTAELEEERSRLQTVLDAAGEAIYFTDADQRMRYANPATVRMTGYPLAEILGQPPSLWRGPTPPAVIDDMEGTLRQGEVWQGEVINRRRDGTLYDAIISLSPLYDAGGHLTGFVGVQRDITYLKELTRLREQFVSQIGHELRTPLTNLHMYLDLLQQGRPEKQEAYIKQLRRATVRLNRLIDGFLELSKWASDSNPLRLVPVNVSQLVVSVVVGRQERAWARDLALSAETQGTELAALAEPEMLRQVMSHLLDNALEYTPAGGQVVVFAEEQRGEEGQEWITLAVQDTGPGLSAEELPRLFDRFYRGEAAANSALPGAGLGLAIAREIVDRLGGRITVASRPGEGATFTVFLRPASPLSLTDR